MLDEAGFVLPGVTVALSNPGVIGGNQETVSDARGAYQFPGLVPGTGLTFLAGAHDIKVGYGEMNEECAITRRTFRTAGARRGSSR